MGSTMDNSDSIVGVEKPAPTVSDRTSFESGLELDGGPILTVPYPIGESGLFQNQLGVFVVGRPKNYAFRANRLSVELAVSYLGYRVHQYPSVSSAVKESCSTFSSQIVNAAIEAADAIEKLAWALLNDAAQSRMSFVFLKPPKLPWEFLENSLTFEPYHSTSLFASDKWNMAAILRRRSHLPDLMIRDANGEVFNDHRFMLYTANPAKNQRAMLKYLDNHPGVYVLKRTDSSQGVGIHFYTAQAPNTMDKVRRCLGPNARLSRYVMQKYIERPLLVDKRKFDLRAYLLVVSCSHPQRPGERGYFAFCHPGYVKVSSRAYSERSRDPRVHFTNQFVQRLMPAQYERVKEATTWLPDELDAYLESRGFTDAGWCRRRMYRQVQSIAGYLAAACRPYLESRHPGCVFRIYGPDLIVDERMGVRLLEFNCFPCYAKNTMALAASVTSMWREAVAVATETALCYRKRLPLTRRVLATERNFRLVHNSERPAVLAELVKSCYP